MKAGLPQSTIYVLDKPTNTKLLVDSGAEVSLFPPSPADRKRGAQGPSLMAANGSPIDSFGFRYINLNIQGKFFTWKFIIADVPTGILGADFLRAHGLMVDLAKKSLVCSFDLSVIKCFSSCMKKPSISLVVTSSCKFAKLLKDRPNLTTPTFHTNMPAHNVELHIPTQGPPVFARPRRLSPEKLAAAKLEFQAMEKMGIIRRSDSPWASPLHMVPKKNGGHRPCGDFRRLNNVTSADLYPIPYLSDANHFLAGKTIFSKIDLVRGYHQIPIAASDIPKTAVITPFGLFEFLRCPFGLKNAAQCFQRLMDRVGGDLDFVFIYLDDVLVASNDENEHLSHLDILFSRLETYGLVVNPDKCIFGVKELEFLGHTISPAGSSPLPAKVEAVAKFPKPTNVLEMQQFMGLINFYNRFIKHISLIMAPLFASTAGKKKKELITWSPELDKSFSAAKSALANAALLSHPNPAAPTALTTDASDVGIGAVLEQKITGDWKPIAFFSKKFSPAESRYSAFDRELLAVHLSIRHFKYFLEGRQFTVFTDHKPITSALGKISDPHSARQARHLAAIAEFTSDIQHVSGKDNAVADALSRTTATAPVLASPEFADYPGFIVNSVNESATNLANIAIAQTADSELQQFIANHDPKKLSIGPVHLPDSPHIVICELSHAAPRPLVPQHLRRPITAELHGLAHPGVKASVRLVKDRFWWPNQAKDVKQWISACIQCQKSKIHRHTRPPTQFIPMPADRFDHLHVDLVGPLPPSNGFSYLLTIVDRYTRWPEAIPISDITTPTIVSAFLYNWISRFGLPRVITSDRGAQFTSALWSQMSIALGIKLSPTTAHHPQANGLVERMHRRLKEALKARCLSSDWFHQLPWVLLSLRATVKEDLNTSPAELVLGAPITLPGDVLPNTPALSVPDRLQHLHHALQVSKPTPTAHHSTQPPPPARLLPPAMKFCFIRKDGYKPPLTAAYEGPFKVLQQTDNTVKVLRGSLTDTISASRVKPAVLDPGEVAAVPPLRGRPPNLTFPSPPSRRTPRPTSNPRPATVQRSILSRATTRPATFSRSGRILKPPARLGQFVQLVKHPEGPPERLHYEGEYCSAR